MIRFYPYLFLLNLFINHSAYPQIIQVGKSLSQDTIWRLGSGFQPDTTSILLRVTTQGDTFYTGQPVDVYLVIDRSGSMEWWDNTTCTGNDRRYYALEGAKTFVRALLPGDQAGLLYFWGDPSVSVGLTANTTALISSLNNPPGGGGTRLYDAIYDGVQYMLPRVQSGRTAVIILLTDGKDCGSSHTRQDALDAAANAEQNNIEFYSIGIGSETPYSTENGFCDIEPPSCVSPTDRPFLLDLARYGQNDFTNNPPNGFYYSTTGADMNQIYLDISKRIRRFAMQKLQTGEHMIIDSLHSYIRYDSAAATIQNKTNPIFFTPKFSIDIAGVDINSVMEAVYSISSNRAGLQPINVAGKSLVQYADTNGVRKILNFPAIPQLYVMDALPGCISIINSQAPDHQSIAVTVDTSGFKGRLAVDAVFIYYSTSNFITNPADPNQRSYIFTGTTNTFLVDGLVGNTKYWLTLSVRNTAGHRTPLSGDLICAADTARTRPEVGKPASLELIFYDQGNPVLLPALPGVQQLLANSSQTVGARVYDAFGNPASDGTIIAFNGSLTGARQAPTVGGLATFNYTVPLGLDTLRGQVLNDATVNDIALIEGRSQGYYMVISSSPNRLSNSSITVDAGAVFPLYFFLIDISTGQPAGKDVSVTITSPNDVIYTLISQSSTMSNASGSGGSFNLHFSASTQAESVAVLWFTNTRAQNKLEIVGTSTIDSKTVIGTKSDIAIKAGPISFIRIVKRNYQIYDVYNSGDSLRDTALILDANGEAQFNFLLFAAGFDQYGNFDSTVVAQWRSSEPRFMINLFGKTYRFFVNNWGQGILTINYSSLQGLSGVITVIDKQSPKLVSEGAWTKDVDGNGYIDRIYMKFDEGVKINSAAVTSPGQNISIVNKINSKLITYSIQAFFPTGLNEVVYCSVQTDQPALLDTDSRPEIQIKAAPVIIQDSSGNFPAADIFANCLDSAGPVIATAIFDNNSTETKKDDKVTITFSERIRSPFELPTSDAPKVFFINNPKSSINKLAGKETEMILGKALINSLPVKNRATVSNEASLVLILPQVDQIHIISDGLNSLLIDAFGNIPHVLNRRVTITQAGIGNPFTDFITYPNPYRPGMGRDPIRVRYNLFEDVEKIIFNIFTSAGELIKSYEVSGNNPYGYGSKYRYGKLQNGLSSYKDFPLWDGTNKKGRYVASGVYICKVYAKIVGSSEVVSIVWKIGIDKSLAN